MCPRVSEEYKREKKLEILTAARRVFIRKGYTRTVMQDIMDEAGMSRGAVYAYFDNVEHVFIEVLRFDDQETLRFFEPDPQYPIWNQLMDWVRKQQGDIALIQHSLVLARAEFFLSSSYVHAEKDYPYLTERYQLTVEAMGRVIRKGREQGEFRPRLEPEAIARYMISFLNGLMLDTFQLGPTVTCVPEQLETFIQSLCAMLNPITIEL
ncbi:TetR family transcriptional regulator [Paenibacillus lautus]|uniref:TetR family transcriptional regulator n=1 Tax=Paenibacillus lautus TaxID=1401 RepID=UPI002DBD8464|nr:TetR family transcriptional regulator [Paenibacillus lautus]MEC0255305.1 TetR family transcriptional regulator [Paenibacillus lautus]